MERSCAVARGIDISKHVIACYASSCIAWCAMLPARVRSGPRKHQRRARSDEVPWSTRHLNNVIR
jgi:hypothetical protein